ncbi:nucleotidyltransferase domain-containing protein [Sphingopyxis sp. OPL5]|uniref:nucleotidyltransferase domain-containing protein n=1 Tax=Sphingopyxis sp. OPL5 TaxID=2486273 RepID=UPI00164E48A3|nr:nucleotidyltransferase domain-containing protein [Sphingopyxis sp. OPL5]QNO28989.1 nucleotidyltransferase domain-containing protein [Sphingopyxis sp. OPL5]
MSIEPAIRQDIENRLSAVEAEDGVRLLLAIESGSRAWGFPSPDSDYDVRFLYVRPRRDYLALSPVRDVIEREIVDEIDLNGWDIRKALGLMLRNNSVLSEWIGSPIEYRDPDPFVARMAELKDRHFDPNGFALHYAKLGRTAIARWLQDESEVAVKRYFYALRPALAIRVLRRDPSRRPPMQLQQLMAEADLPASLAGEIERLVAMKADTREAGPIARLPEIDALIADELGRADEVPARPTSEAFAAEANDLFLELVEDT